MQYVKAIKVMVTYGYGDPFPFDVAVPGKMLDGPTKKKNGVQYVKAIKGLVACECAGELFLFDAACQGKKLVGPTSDISQCIAFKHCLAVQSGFFFKGPFLRTIRRAYGAQFQLLPAAPLRAAAPGSKPTGQPRAARS